MSRIFRDSSVLNQFGSPSINSNTLANRPTFGQPGRLFVSTDTLAIFRDTGTGWDNITDNPGNIGTLQEVTTNGNQTTLSIEILARESVFTKTFDTDDIGGDSTAILNVGSNVNLSNAVLGIHNLFSESYKTITSNVTFEADSHIDNTYIYNVISNNSLSSKSITVTQGTFINALSGIRIQSIFGGINSLTVSHYASIIVNPLTITNGTITNYYGLLLNASTGSTITNRWGIYQNGANDFNYFAGNTILGGISPVDNGNKLQVAGNIVPNASFSYSIGTSSLHFTGLFAQTLFNSISPTLSIIATQGKIVFSTQASTGEVARFENETGNLLLGTTTNTNAVKLKVNGIQEWSNITFGTGTHTTSGNHLPIYVNGVQYWLALLNPLIP